MFQHKFSEEIHIKTLFDWLILTFLAGNINVGGYLSCHRFVSHITGFATLSGVSLEEGNWFDALGTLAIPLFFLFGVMVSGYLTERQTNNNIQGQKYAPVMWLVAGLMLLVSIGGYYDWFGTFGTTADLSRDFFLLACLCGACGLQNAAITSASGFTVRTTHLTGLTTDLGLGIVKAEMGHLSEQQKKIERAANFRRLATIAAFTLGSAVGAFVFSKYKYLGFLLPFALAVYCANQAHKKQPTQI